jgi:hypothetical protein
MNKLFGTIVLTGFLAGAIAVHCYAQAGTSGNGNSTVQTNSGFNRPPASPWRVPGAMPGNGIGPTQPPDVGQPPALGGFSNGLGNNFSRFGNRPLTNGIGVVPGVAGGVAPMGGPNGMSSTNLMVPRNTFNRRPGRFGTNAMVPQKGFGPAVGGGQMAPGGRGKGAGTANPNAVNPFMPNTGTVNPNTGAIVPNTGVVNPNTGAIVPNTGTINPNTGAFVPNTGTVNPNTGPVVPGPGTLNPNNGFINPKTTPVNPGIPLRTNALPR